MRVFDATEVTHCADATHISIHLHDLSNEETSATCAIVNHMADMKSVKPARMMLISVVVNNNDDVIASVINCRE